jgi:hypothetical protein
VSNGGQNRGGLSALIPRLRRAPAASADTVFRSTAVASFLEAVGSRQPVVLMDLGPVIGSNIALLGERVACKIHVEDLYADLDRHAQQDTLDAFPRFLETRFPVEAASIDGMLCWDLFDYLDDVSGHVLAAQLTRMLRPGGALLALFATTTQSETSYTKYVIENEADVRCRTYPGACGRRRVLQNAEVIKLFGELRVSGSVLLRSQLREMLFRKPAASAA